MIYPIDAFAEILYHTIASYHNKAKCRSRFETAARFAGHFFMGYETLGVGLPVRKRKEWYNMPVNLKDEIANRRKK